MLLVLILENLVYIDCILELKCLFILNSALIKWLQVGLTRVTSLVELRNMA